MWSNLSDRRKEFELTPFRHSEIKSAINLFGKQLGEKINPVLRNYLIKQCQGYPWLLKKLCIHVFNLLNEGSSQEAVIGSKLNIVDLFEKDICELTPEEHACIKEIAKESPADYFRIVDVYGNDVVSALINNRMVIRRASKLTLYWDIFADYVINHKIPTIILDYIPQQQFASIAKVLSTLLIHNNISTNELSELTNFKVATIDNIMMDMVMLGAAKRENGLISLTLSNEDELIKSLQSFFVNHILYHQLVSLLIDSFDYNYFWRLFNTIYENSDISDKTKQTYCSKMLNWFIRLGLVFEKDGLFHMGAYKTSNITLSSSKIRRRRNRYSTSENNLFWGQASPEKMIETYLKIQEGMGYTELKQQGLRNAIELLTTTNGVTKNANALIIKKSLDEIFQYIMTSPTIAMAMQELKDNLEIKSDELGEMLNIKFNRDWAPASKKRYGNALLLWAKYLQK
jgi:hypothetical protein